MKVLYDTSVLVAALLVNHADHMSARSKLEMALDQEVQGYLSTHSLAELYSVMTRLPKPLRVFPSEAQATIADLSRYMSVVSLVASDYHDAITQMVALNLPGGAIFDALIAQAAVKEAVDRLLTLNPTHFTRLGSAIANIVEVPN